MNKKLHILRHVAYIWLALLALSCEIPAVANTLDDLIRDEKPLVSEHYLLYGLSDNPRLAESIFEMAEEGHRYLQSRVPPPFPERIRIIWLENPTQFGDTIGDRNPNILAVAIRGTPTMIFNGQAINRDSLRGMNTTFLHEMIHIYIDRRAPVEIPLWLNEGLATNIAYQIEWEPDFRFWLQGMMGNLPTLPQLEERFPDSQAAKNTAYRCSYLAVRYLREVDGMYYLLENLKDPRFIRSFYDTENAMQIDRDYKKRHLTQLNFIFFLTSSNIMWILLSLLFVVAYLRKRFETRQRMERQSDSEDYWDYDYYDYDYYDYEEDDRF